MQSRWRFQRNIILVERHPPRLLHYFASPGELAPSFYVTIYIVTLLILTLCFRMIHLQTACCGGNSATQEPHAAHTSHRNTMPDLAPRPRRASSQPQRMGTQVSGGKDESKIRDDSGTGVLDGVAQEPYRSKAKRTIWSAGRGTVPTHP